MYRDNNKKRIIDFLFGFLLIVLCFGFFVNEHVQASTLSKVRDLISSSAPATTTSHVIDFELVNAVPASGRVSITFEEGGMDIPGTFSLTDIDLSYATSSIYYDRDLALVASPIFDGVTIVPGTTGSVSFDINSTEGFNAGDKLRIEFGATATYSGVGVSRMVTSSTTGPYRVLLETKDDTDTLIDSAHAMFFLILSVGVGPLSNIDDTPPILSNGLPAGLLPGGTVAVMLSVETDQFASCRYDIVSGISYASSTNDFDEAFTFLSTKTITGLVDGTAYDYYLKCVDPQDNESLEYYLAFEVGLDPSIASGTDPTASPEPTSGGGGGGGSIGIGNVGLGIFADTATLVIQGKSYPGSSVTVLQDGVKVDSTSVSNTGSFDFTIDMLERGTYTFGLYAIDSDNEKSATYSSTVSLISGTETLMSPVFMPPTINVFNDTLEAGDDIVLSGFGIANSEIEVIINKQVNVLETDIYHATGTVSSSGQWDLTYNTQGFDEDTYLIKAFTRSPGFDASDFSPVIYVGVGGSPEPDFSLRADLNKDGYVNLVDFSILVFFWGTNDDVADINMDGIVDLTDFSIMIFFWTG